MRVNIIYVCPVDAFMREAKDATCLGVLHLALWPAARRLCPMHIIHNDQVIEPRGNSTYTIVTHPPSSFQLICNDNKVADMKVDTIKVLALNHSCQARWGSAVMHGPVHINLSVSLMLTPINMSTWNDSRLAAIDNAQHEEITNTL